MKFARYSPALGERSGPQVQNDGVAATYSASFLLARRDERSSRLSLAPGRLNTRIYLHNMTPRELAEDSSDDEAPEEVSQQTVSGGPPVWKSPLVRTLIDYLLISRPAPCCEPPSLGAPPTSRSRHACKYDFVAATGEGDRAGEAKGGARGEEARAGGGEETARPAGARVEQ